MVKIKLTKKSRIDLQAIEDFIAEDNPSRAKSFVEEIIQSFISTVGEFPLSSPIYNRHKSIRRFIFHSYNVYYHFNEAKQEVTVLHVLNASVLKNITLREL